MLVDILFPNEMNALLHVFSVYLERFYFSPTVKFADGVFIGSTILKLHDNIPALIKEINEFKKNC